MWKGFLKRLKERERLRREKLENLVRSAKGMKLAVLLFGSRARSSERLSSDFDLLLLGDDAPKFAEMVRRAGIPADVHVYSLKEAMDEMPTSSLLLDALQEGVLLYDGVGVRPLLERAKGLRKNGIGRVKGGWRLAKGSK